MSSRLALVLISCASACAAEDEALRAPGPQDAAPLEHDDAGPVLSGAPFRLAAAEPGGLFVSLTHDRGQPIAVYCAAPCTSPPSLRMVSWDTLEPDAPTRSLSTSPLQAHVSNVRVTAAGVFALHHGDDRIARIARVDPRTGVVTDTPWLLGNYVGRWMVLEGDEDSDPIGVRITAWSEDRRLLIHPSGDYEQPDGCAPRVGAGNWAWQCGQDITLGGAFDQPLAAPSERGLMVGLSRNELFYSTIASPGAHLWAIPLTGEAGVDLGELPTDAATARQQSFGRYLGGAQRGVGVAYAAAWVHERELGTWSKLLDMPPEPHRGGPPAAAFFEPESSVIEVPDALLVTNGAEVWVVPSRR